MCNVKYNVYYIFANRIYGNVKLLLASENRREMNSDFSRHFLQAAFSNSKIIRNICKCEKLYVYT